MEEGQIACTPACPWCRQNSDPLSLAGAALAMALLGLVTTWIPASGSV